MNEGYQSFSNIFSRDAIKHLGWSEGAHGLRHSYAQQRMDELQNSGQRYQEDCKRSYFRLHEKGGKYNVIPAHHVAQSYVDAYITAAGIDSERKTPLFRTSGRGRQKNELQNKEMSRFSALQMVKRRAVKAGLPSEICNHTFRGTGITEFMRNGGDLETAARIAGHDSTRTTQIYDRTDHELSLDEIERIHI